VQLNVRVRLQCEPDIRVAGQRLRHAGRDAGLFQARDERVPQRMEIGIASEVVAVG
jgi:hypothetical protein